MKIGSAKTRWWLLSIMMLMLCLPVMAEESISNAPANVQMALFVKLLALNKTIARSDKVTLLVVGSFTLANTMQVAIGKPLGQATLKEVKEGEVPAGKVDGLVAIYVGDPKQWDGIKAYCREHKILSMSGLPELVNQGVSLIVGVHNKKPKVILDLAASKAEDVHWDHQILKIATLINK